jgi:YidC/Oxa1 family membrane protein insertase
VDIKRLIPMLVLLGAIVVFAVVSQKKKGDAPEDPAVGTPIASELSPGTETDPTLPPVEPELTAPTPEPPTPSEVTTPAPVTDTWRGDVVKGDTMVTIGSLSADQSYAMAYTFNNIGAGVESMQLKEFFVTEADKRAFEDAPAGYAAMMEADPEKYKGHYRLLESVKLKDRTLRALATRNLWVKLDGVSTVSVDLSNKRWTYEGTTQSEDGTNASVAFSYTIYFGKDANPQAAPNTPDAVLKITKRFTLEPDTYSLAMDVTLENLSDKNVFAGFDQVGTTSLEIEDPRSDMRRIAYGRALSDDEKIQVRQNKKWSKMSLGAATSVGRSDSAEPIVWIGTTNKYFASLIYAQPVAGVTDEETGMLLAAPTLRADFYEQRAQAGVTALTGIRVGTNPAFNGKNIQSVPPMMLLAPAGMRTATFMVFTGPKDMAVFTDTNDDLHRSIYEQLNFMSAIEFGKCCTWQWMSLKMMWVLAMLSKLTFGNYGLGIILLVVLVRLVLHPLTKKSQLSMMKMQKMQPQMQKLKEKYADDKETLNREMMRMYKEQGASPVLGCLPMLLQMPILISMFTGINATVALRHAAFLPVWLTNLAAPDALFSWSKSLPLIGNQFNLLPLLLCVVMFLQMKMNPSMAGAAAAPAKDGGGQMAQQQKMMKFMMPVMMLVFFYHAPSGLTLYFMASTAAGLLDQWAVRRHIRNQEAETAGLETIIDAPGKGARGNRPKKDKPSFKTGM